MRIWAEVCFRRPALPRNFGNWRGSLRPKNYGNIRGANIKKHTQSNANLGTNSAVGWSKVEGKLDGVGRLQDLPNTH
jgi:hypothetical protein